MDVREYFDFIVNRVHIQERKRRYSCSRVPALLLPFYTPWSIAGPGKPMAVHSSLLSKKASRPRYSLLMISNSSSGLSLQLFFSHSFMICVMPALKNSM